MTAVNPTCDSLDQLSDDELLLAVAVSEDVKAFNLLFNRFAAKIQAMGMKLTHNEQLSKDLLQEAMLAVWQKAPLFDADRGSARGWIFTLVRNRCFDMLRQQKRQPGMVNADDIWCLESDLDESGQWGQSEEQFFNNLEVTQFEKYYRQLPEPQQQVIKQIYVNGLTHEEVAQLLQIPPGTVKSRLRLGMDKLRQLIGITP